jgi:hypothetical protein
VLIIIWKRFNMFQNIEKLLKFHICSLQSLNICTSCHTAHVLQFDSHFALTFWAVLDSSPCKCTLCPGTVDTTEKCLSYMVDHFEIVFETHVGQWWPILTSRSAEHRTPFVVEPPFSFTALPSGSKQKHVWMHTVDETCGVFLCF